MPWMYHVTVTPTVLRMCHVTVTPTVLHMCHVTVTPTVLHMCHVTVTPTVLLFMNIITSDTHRYQRGNRSLLMNLDPQQFSVSIACSTYMRYWLCAAL